MSLKNTLIGTIYRNLLKPFLFLQDPEKIHDKFTKTGLILGKHRATRTIVRKLFRYDNPRLEQNILGIDFKNPVGLSAGFDKDSNLRSILPEVGFGFMQIGSITDKPYEGNPKPRLIRLPKSKGLVVYYGLKNIGVEKIIAKIKESKRPNFPISISIAKTNCTETATLKAGIEDYYQCLKKCQSEDVGDFYTINISCPNTFGGEPFNTPESLEQLLSKLTSIQIQKPLFLKMPINLEWSEFQKLLEIAVKYQIPGVIIGNLSKERDPKLIKDDLPADTKGGISGKPTWALSNNLISQTYKHYHQKLTIIGVGGIFSAEDAYEKIKRGSSLVQLITGMIFQGPQLIGQINEGLVKLLEEDGYKNISEAIGAYHKN